MTRLLTSLAVVAFVCATLTLLAPLAHAGPPLICWPFDIGNANSLPFQGPGWRTVDPHYDTGNLVHDALRLLSPDVPVIVRMETLRRATVYAMKDPRAARGLLESLLARVHNADRNSRSDALALFDAGYLVEAYKQAAAWPGGVPEASQDGYAMVRKAITLRSADPEMEFAAALILAGRERSRVTPHLEKAVAGATEGSLLALNLVTHSSLLLGRRVAALSELRANLGTPKS